MLDKFVELVKAILMQGEVQWEAGHSRSCWLVKISVQLRVSSAALNHTIGLEIAGCLCNGLMPNKFNRSCQSSDKYCQLWSEVAVVGTP